MASDEILPSAGLTHDPAITLALAYARAKDRPIFEDLFTLDRRLADATRQASEPIIAQMKLAWWRDRFAQYPAHWPKGEPLLARLAAWNGDVSQLGTMVDGWEALLAEGRLTDDAIRAFAEGRADAWAVAAESLGEPEPPVPDHAGLLWSYADLAQNCSSAEDAERVRALAHSQSLLAQGQPPLPRVLRPFVVLGVLGRRSLAHARPILGSGGDFLAAVRAGMLGR
ncbi:hypothetical protein [Alteriqipengyuania lutimaris]|uniref:Phytoene synthase n=1 Tax=Alteriqipengyuania lutimaris TaxID=1538146 RepID=A0A395LRA7_9SPHN|nr:hypothetical protein [Alteriqipengyuania lutimaris]MBB3032841.1 phytoene synthase [Alteriqipengyuania lutimaris]RDS78064.1 hypothetical protein DL238_10945 [Alteriqipengyuania lutimaris]